jgi:Ca2+-binding RTX toxin-like protein
MGHGNDTVMIGKGGIFEAIDLQRDADTIKFAADATGSGHINGGDTISSDLPGAKNFDTLDFSAFTKALTIDLNAASALATDVNYQVTGFERVIGGSKGDKLYGSSGAETLDGGAGNDTLNGRAGADTFVFKTGYDADTIDGFTAKGASHDTINLSFQAIQSFDDLKPLMANDHGDAVIDFGHGDTLTLTGVAVKNLTEADFHF